MNIDVVAFVAFAVFAIDDGGDGACAQDETKSNQSFSFAFFRTKLWRVIRFVRTPRPQQHSNTQSVADSCIRSARGQTQSKKHLFCAHLESRDYKIKTELSGKNTERKQQRKINVERTTRIMCFISFTFLFLLSLCLFLFYFHICCANAGTNNNNIIDPTIINTMATTDTADERNNIKIKITGTNTIIGIFGFRH